MDKFGQCALLFVVLAMPAAATEPTVVNDGHETCSAWTSSISATSEHANSMRSWVVEYVEVHAAKKDIDTRHLISWIDGFCGANPSQTIHSAAEEFVFLNIPDPDHPLVE